jgi:hypothetical protein
LILIITGVIGKIQSTKKIFFGVYCKSCFYRDNKIIQNNPGFP